MGKSLKIAMSLLLCLFFTMYVTQAFANTSSETDNPELIADKYFQAYVSKDIEGMMRYSRDLN
ncbi:hypothetical protein [Paenibacillus nasutitermitis]|uniref:Uncharacterized protein n=1 Tax=Paenibacillus nasutitermitis TaxID=1652958 RepID=A0A917DYG1_9BACL|nr:hypothetical protein [Paenibacillus nasutitermitis]GGD82154.1 hypothetical protein GCM10010911_45340 [Paenibacillus nasutitermitis]